MTPDEIAQLDLALAKIRSEAIRARKIHEPFHSIREAHSVLQEEYEEFWDDVKADRLNPAIAEAIQVGAVAARIIAEFTDNE